MRITRRARTDVLGRRGFTLLELMVTVVIVAILTVVAFASYKKFQRNARRGDGVSLMNDIRMKQETFFSTYSRYVSSTTDETEFQGVPLTAQNYGLYEWDVDCPDASSPWCQIGFKPKGVETLGGHPLLYFQLQTIAWAPGVAAPSFINDTSTHWWSVQARGLPEGNNFDLCTLLRISSDSRELASFGQWEECQ